MRYLLAFHIIAMVCWFAGLFYLPRLFVYHANTKDHLSIERFKLMEYKLFFYIMTPSALLTVGFGTWLVGLNPDMYMHQIWFLLKLSLVFLLIIFHLYCGKLLRDFKRDINHHSVGFYKIFNEIPTL